MKTTPAPLAFCATPFAPAPPVLSSVGRDWNGVVAEEVHQGAHRWPVPTRPEHGVFLVLRHDGGRVRHHSGGQHFDGPAFEGALTIAPAGIVGHCHSEARVEGLQLRLDTEFVARVAEENFGSVRFHLLPQIGMRDDSMRQIALLMRAELASNGAGGALLTESLTQALTVYLLRFHAHFHKQGAEPICELCGGLSARALVRVEELVREGLASNLSLDDMASAAKVSRFHFARSFKSSTGQTPYQFVLSQRIERAKVLLLQNRLSLREVAQESGFSDQSHLTRHFRRATGTTPRGFQAASLI